MRVLFVSSSFPTDLQTKVGGVYQRMRLFIDAIKEFASLDMLFYAPAEVDVSPRARFSLEKSLSKYWQTSIRLSLCPRLQLKGEWSRWQLYGSPAFNFFQHPDYLQTSGLEQVETLERSLENSPDVIFAHKLASMCPMMLTKTALPPVFFDLDDIEHVVVSRVLRQEPRWRVRLLHTARLPALLWGEHRAIRSALRTFVCSELDRKYLQHRWRLPGIVTIPNAISVPKMQPLTTDPTLLFIGSYLYQPNVDAAEFLISKVWPFVHQRMPAARLIIAGHPPDRIRGYADDLPGVEFTGLVSNLDDLYHRSRVVCAPILSGGGTRVKIIEAAVYGKPVVATRLGAEGLDLRDGHELLLRDDTQSFAESCVELLNDFSLCKKLGLAARDMAIQRYDRSEVVRLIQKHMTQSYGQELLAHELSNG